jgi:hypothetical protein
LRRIVTIYLPKTGKLWTETFFSPREQSGKLWTETLVNYILK